MTNDNLQAIEDAYCYLLNLKGRLDTAETAKELSKEAGDCLNQEFQAISCAIVASGDYIRTRDGAEVRVSKEHRLTLTGILSAPISPEEWELLPPRSQLVKGIASRYLQVAEAFQAAAEVAQALEGEVEEALKSLEVLCLQHPEGTTVALPGGRLMLNVYGHQGLRFFDISDIL